MATKTVSVPNITCGHCVATIERELSEIPGINRVVANVEKKLVTVEWDEDEASWPAVSGTLAEIGFPAAEA